jgi:hypothetical protein
MSFSICGTVGANTGAIECDVRRGIPANIVVGGAAFTEAEYATAAAFKTAFKSRLKLATGSNEKLFPFPEIQGVTNKTEAPKEGTLGLGLKEILLDGKPGYEFDVVVGTSLEKRLRKFNSQQIPVMILDQNGNIWGKLDDDNKFIGTKVLIYIVGQAFGDGNGSTMTKIQISFVSAKDFYDSAAFVTSTLTSSDMVGLLDADLSYVSKASNVYKVKAHIATAQAGVKLSVYDQFADALASADKWVAKTGAGFETTLAITTVAKDTAIKGWTITFDSTAFTALSAGASIKLSLVDPATLDAADIVDIEGVPVILTK